MKKTDKAVTSGKARRTKRKAPAPQQRTLRPEFYQLVTEALHSARANAPGPSTAPWLMPTGILAA